MKTLNEYPTNYLDILFLNRNKAYGAYHLKTNYSKHALWALLFPLLSLGLLVAYASFSGSKVEDKLAPEMVTTPSDGGVVIRDVVLQPIEIPTAAASSKTVARDVSAFTTPKIVKNKPSLAHTDPLQKPDEHTDIGAKNHNTDGQNSKFDFENSFGTANNGNGNLPNGSHTDNNRGDGDGDATVGNSNAVIAQVDKKAKPPKQIIDLIKRLLRYPEMAKANGITGHVLLSFIVEKDGSLTNVQIDGKRVGGGLEEEAIRVVKLLPKWEAAELQGEKVRSYHKLPIVFTLSN